MRAAGLSVDPIQFCEFLKEKKIKFSVDSCQEKTAVFIGTESFNRSRAVCKDGATRLLVFDAKERLQMLTGLPIINGNLSSVWDKVKGLKPVTIQFKNRDYIKETLDSNKDREGGFLHAYNTNLYRILPKPSREGFKDQFFSLLNGSMSRKDFEKKIRLYPPRRGKSAEAMQALVDLTSTPAFANMQECVREAIGVKKDKDVVAIAQKYDVPAFDLRYVLSTLSKKRAKP